MNGQVHRFDQESFPFDDVTLANPQGLQGGTYLSRIKVLSNPITIQTIRCKTKNGIVKTEKKIYCDLMFDRDNDEVMEFFNRFEAKIKNLIYEKKDVWFHSEMDMDTIDYHWQPTLRTYKNSKLLLRCFIKKPRSRIGTQPIIQIYDEDETLLKIADLVKGKSIMALLEISGLKFTSQSFSLEFSMKQAMILRDRVVSNKCLITLNNKTQHSDPVSDVSASVEKSKSEKPDSISLDNPSLKSTTSEVPSLGLSVAENDYLGSDNSDDDGEEAGGSKESRGDGGEVTDFQDVNDDREDKKYSYPDSTLPVPNGHIEDNLDASANNLAENTGNAPIINIESLEKTDELKEIDLDMPNNSDTVTLKNPNEVYMEIYREVRRRAKEAKKRAVEAYLEVKRIKSLYLLNEIESSDEDDDDFLGISK